jgi:hypothetical protein
MRRIVDAFGTERLMWASDLTRLRPLFHYSELLDWLRYAPELTQSEKQQLLGGSVRALLGWPRDGD